MKRETKQNIYAYDSEGNIVDTTTGIFNLNFGQGTPYGTGTSTTFGIFTLTSDSEPIVDYTAGTMSIQTRRNYESGWYQDYQYNLPFPVGDLNVFLADMTSGGASKPENVPVSSKVQIINEKKRGQSFLTETGPTTAEAVFTTDGGNEYRLIFANYHRFAGFSTDGIFAVAGTAESFDLGSITFLSSDYSTLTDGFYTEKLTIDDQECTLTYRPIGGLAIDELGDYESDCPKLGNGSWKSSKGPEASLEKYIEEEIRVDDVITRTCGDLNGDNSKCQDRSITGTITQIYFSLVKGNVFGFFLILCKNIF